MWVATTTKVLNKMASKLSLLSFTIFIFEVLFPSLNALSTIRNSHLGTSLVPK